MVVSTVLSRIKSTIQSSLEMRASSEDEVEWECALGMMQVVTPDGAMVEIVPSVNIYIRLSRLDSEEGGVETKVYEPLPLDLCTNEFVSSWIDDTWDALVISGIEVTLD